MLTFVAHDSTGKDYLWIKQLNSPTAQKLNGTEGAYFPFWSYDSKNIAYFAQDKLKKIPATGGPSFTICKAASGRGGSWGKNNIIVFANFSTTPISKVSADGGEREKITNTII